MAPISALCLVVCTSLFFLVLAAANASQDLEPLLERHQRSIAGQPCNNDTGFQCNLAYTVCNRDTGFCECDQRLSVPMTMPLFPEVITCIPFDYVAITGLCLPTNPDICARLVPGSFCDAAKRDGSPGKMKCACKIGGQYPNCVVRVGSICRTDDVCQKDIPDSYCGDIINGFGKCTCGTVDAKGFVSNRAGTACKPTNCAAKPCRGDPAASTCVDSSSGYECRCNNNTKGRTHDFANEGICCSEHMVTCRDFSKCIKVTDLCNEISDCDDCSDEMEQYCTGPLPKNNPRCFRTFAPAGTTTGDQASTKETPASQAGLVLTTPTANAASQTNIVNPNMQAAIQVAQQAASSGLNALAESGNNRQFNPYSGAANILRTSIPTLAIPSVGVIPGFG